MSKMIQIRHVPDRVHRTLKVRAAEAGMSLSDYLLREIQEMAGRPTMQEVLDRIASRPPVQVSEPAADIIRRMRDAE